MSDWLREKALDNEGRASRTYVITTNNNVVIAYYCLAFGCITHAEAVGKVKRNMPNPIPAMLVGRLAVDRKWKGGGLGRGMLRDAVIRTLEASKVAGLQALFVHAISEDAKNFYLKCGLLQSPINEMTLMITIKDAQAAL